MAYKFPWLDSFVEKLLELAPHADRQRWKRGDLAMLRQGLRGHKTLVLTRTGRIFSSIPNFALDKAIWVAGLFAMHPQHHPGDSFGIAFCRLRVLMEARGKSTDSLERRFSALVDSDSEDLDSHLIRAVSLLRSEEIGLDWGCLLQDILEWDNTSRYIQTRWARSFWANQTPEESETSPTTTLSE